jgi:integrase
MRRKRFQRGSLGARKHGRVRVWVAQWWENGGRRSKVLGRCAKMTQGEAETILAAILRPINEGTAAEVRPVYTFGQFVELVYLPHCRRTWKGSTASTSENTINTHLVPAFRDRLVRTIGRDDMQDLLDSKAAKLSRSMVSHLRWYLNAIFKLAMSDGIVDHNPAAELRIPKLCKRGRRIRALTEEEVIQYLDVLELRERLMARLAIFEGFRPGEVLALKWGALEGEFFQVRERVYDGMLDTPKSGEARESALSDGTLQDLSTWRNVARSTAPDAFVFPSERLSTPVSLKNVWRRFIEPKLKPVGLDWATFQVLRKTNATLSRKAGVDAKVSADQRGHGLGVSMQVYTMSDRQQKREAVTKLESAVARKRKPKLSA